MVSLTAEQVRSSVRKKVGTVDRGLGLGLHLGIADNVKEFDDVGPTAQVLEDFDFAPDFLLLHWLQDLDHTALKQKNKK
jgi:hypothetical protein